MEIVSWQEGMVGGAYLVLCQRQPCGAGTEAAQIVTERRERWTSATRQPAKIDLCRERQLKRIKRHTTTPQSPKLRVSCHSFLQHHSQISSAAGLGLIKTSKASLC